jgi:hypothetical protein
MPINLGLQCINYTYIRARDPPIISVKNTNKLTHFPVSLERAKREPIHSLKEPPKKRRKCDNFRIRNCNWVTYFES